MIKIEQLHKRFGKNQVLKGVDLTFAQKGIVAVLGPNGSGKTTLIKALLGMVIPDKGKLYVDNISIKSNWKYRDQIDYLPQIANFPSNLTVKELIAMITDIRNRKVDDKRLVALFKLEPFLSKKLSTLSGGTKQKVNIVLTLMFDSPIIILDEPTTGLDPNQLVEIRELIKTIGKEKTVMLSTHIMQEVEAICDRVIIINNGKIVADKKLDNLISEEKEQVIEVEFDYKIEEQAIAKIENLFSYKNTHDMIWELTFKTDKDMRPAVFDFATANGLKTLQLNQKNKNLEAIFREITK